MKEENENKKNTKKSESKSTKKNLEYMQKLIITIFITLFLLIISILLIVKSISFISEQQLSYIEKSKLDYRVYLKENDFYESEYLGKNMSYIASLIDFINISFDYNFLIDKPIDADFNYQIIAILKINNEDSSSNFFSKEYILLDNKTKNMTNEKTINISENIKVDYDYYNQLANKFKKTYGINTISNLEIYFKINRNADIVTTKGEELDANNFMLLNIPLSQKAINIKMQYDEINNYNNVISNSKIDINNLVLLIIGIVLLIFNIIFTIVCLRKISLIRDNNIYDKYIKKILREYDRLIVITGTIPDFYKFNVFKVHTFNELLDVRDNTKKPIIYYNVTGYKKCYFYVKDDNDLYLLTLTATDIEKNNSLQKNK